MLPRRAKSDLVFGLLVLVTVPGTAVTNWLVDVVDRTGASFLHEVVIVEGAGITALIGVALYEVFIAPWHWCDLFQRPAAFPAAARRAAQLSKASSVGGVRLSRSMGRSMRDQDSAAIAAGAKRTTNHSHAASA